MPIFDFICEDCLHEFSDLVWGEEIIACPQCQSTKLKKLVNSFNTISDNTKFETQAKDLPSMAEFQRAKKGLPPKPKKKLTTKVLNTKHAKKVLKKR